MFGWDRSDGEVLRSNCVHLSDIDDKLSKQAEEISGLMQGMKSWEVAVMDLRREINGLRHQLRTRMILGDE